MEKENQLWDMYKKELNGQIEDTSNGDLDENNTENSSEDTSKNISKENGSEDDSISQLDSETGEAKRKRESESEEAECSSRAKKQETESQTNKRSADDYENQEVDSSKKTRVDDT